MSSILLYFFTVAAMKFNENLKELFLGGNRIVPEDCQNIGNILRTNHTLTYLDLRDNSIQVIHCIVDSTYMFSRTSGAPVP